MPQVLRLDGVAAKVESGYAVDAAPSLVTDGVKIASRLWPSVELDYEWENDQRDVVTGTILSETSALPRGRKIRAEIPWIMRGAGSAYSGGARAEADALWRASGMAASVVSNTVEYVQASTGHESATCYLYAGGYRFKAVGCRAVTRWPIQAGRLGIMPITIFGIVVEDPTVTALPAITYDAQEPIAGVGMTLSIGGVWTPNVISGEFNQGVDPQLLEDANAADGIEQFDYGEATPSFSLVARSMVATYDAYAHHKARTGHSINLTHGQGALNRVKLQVTTARLNRVRHQQAKGFTTWDLGWELRDWKIITD